MSPLMLSIMSHYFMTSDVDVKNMEFSAVEECLRVLLAAEMIYESPANSNSRFHGNKTALAVYFQKVFEIPLPEKRWVIPESTDRPQFMRRVID